MAKRIHFILSLLLVLSILLFNNASANFLYVVSNDAAICSIHGDVKINVRTAGLDSSSILVEAKHSSDSEYSKIEGLWYDQRDNVINFLQNDEEVIFRSLGTFFTKSGEYTVKMSYKNSSEEIKLSCPEFKFSCNDIKIDVKECYSEKNNFVIVFLGKGLESQKTILDLEEDIQYRIESQRQSWGFGSLPLNLSFERLENETYKMIFPMNREYPVKSNQLKEVEIKLMLKAES